MTHMNKDKMREDILTHLKEHLSESYEVATTGANNIAIEIPADEPYWVKITVSIPKGERVKQPGQPTYYLGFDGREEEELYLLELEAKQKKKDEVQARKEKKIAVDKKRRELEQEAKKEKEG